MTQEIDFQEAFTTAAARVEVKRAELKACEVELSGIVGRLVDATGKERPGLITRRAELVNMRGLLVDEVAELEARRDAAYLAIYLYAEDQARAESQRLGSLAREKRHEMNAFLDEYRRFMNREGRRNETEEDTRQRVEMDMKKARLMAESSIAGRNAEKAAALLVQTQAATQQARQELKAPALVM